MGVSVSRRQPRRHRFAAVLSVAVLVAVAAVAAACGGSDSTSSTTETTAPTTAADTGAADTGAAETGAAAGETSEAAAGDVETLLADAKAAGRQVSADDCFLFGL